MTDTVLSIAGSDPTGGAGIQADLKTMTAAGVYGAAVITCVTVQNSYGVSRVEPLHPVLVTEQLEAVLADHMVTHIKIGMVGNAAIAKAIAARLTTFAGEVIYDPVLTSTTGEDLVDKVDVADVFAYLLCRTTILTPNLPELEHLAQKPLPGEHDISSAVDKLFTENEHLRCILVKGGHAGSSRGLTDCLFYRKEGRVEAEKMTHPYITTRNTHGTGCTLAAAFAAYLSLGGGYVDAFRQSVAFLQLVLEKSRSANLINNPKGKGGMLHHLAASAHHE